MTRTRYLFWRIAQTFGIQLKQRHATHAAAEIHLLREAEEILGRLSWEDAEHIEELSVEYWNLRKLTKKYSALYDKVDHANDHLQKSHDQRAEILGVVVEGTKDLVEQRKSLVEKSDLLEVRREAILAEARQIKRRHEGVKAKLEVLTGEGTLQAPEVDASRKELVKLQEQFKSLRGERDEVAGKIKELAAELKTLDTTIEKQRSHMRNEAFGSYQDIGRANRDISQSRAELGLLENEMAALFVEIGRYLLVHHAHPSVTQVASKHRGLIDQMAALRVSITLNNRLSGRELPAAGQAPNP